MFDCSIFTEYSDRDLSCMSENIANKWRSRLTKDQSRKLKKSRHQLQPPVQPPPAQPQEDREVEEVVLFSETMALVRRLCFSLTLILSPMIIIK